MREDYTKFANQDAVDVKEEPVVAKPVIGFVDSCVKLNVREKPNRAAQIVCELMAGDEVEVEEGTSTGEFYKIYTAAGVEGYCMKDFIAIES